MITFEKAVNIILNNTKCLPVTSVGLAESLGYALAETIKAREPIPRFDSSAVDGYAVRFEDLQNVSERNPKLLTNIGQVRAGDNMVPILRKGYAIKIFTGAPIPLNTNAIVMVEHTKENNSKRLFLRRVEKGENIRKRGAEFRKGNILVDHGTLITPPIIGLLASLGYQKIAVFKKPRVGLVVNGDELQAPGIKLQRGMIHDSNSFALIAALQSAGINPVIVRRTKDNKRSIKLALEEVIKLSDVVISVGGVSVGEYDFVKEIFTELGVKKIFWKIAIKPGKPNYFGTYGKKLIFGLPGNPVAAMVSFHQLVMPALEKMMGVENRKSFHFEAELSSSLKKKAGRLEFVRGIVSQNRTGGLIVMPTKGQDSHMLGGLAKANCLIHFPKKVQKISKDKKITISMLNWNMF